MLFTDAPGDGVAAEPDLPHHARRGSGAMGDAAGAAITTILFTRKAAFGAVGALGEDDLPAALGLDLRDQMWHVRGISASGDRSS